jgi:hypothetical protein
VIPGSTIRPATLQPPCLGREPKARVATVELVAVPDKSSHSTNQTFLQQVINRFRACAKCLTNQRSEFRGKFQDLLDHALIDHRRTSRDHP